MFNGDNMDLCPGRYISDFDKKKSHFSAITGIYFRQN